jgi:hypothetical protein
MVSVDELGGFIRKIRELTNDQDRHQGTLDHRQGPVLEIPMLERREVPLDPLSYQEVQ